MGTGTLAGYAEPRWQIDYYEIDPAVPRIANNTDYFTYIPDAIKRGVQVETILGDGRLQIQKHAPDGAYDLIFMDAFSSDSVPVHLLTKEAIEMYLKKLAPGGIIIVNIANRYLDFRPVFGNLAEELHLASIVGGSHYVWAADLFGCDWVFLARDKQDFGTLNEHVGGWHNNGMWTSLPLRPELGVWKDDFSNLLGIFDWGRSEVKTPEEEEE
jgi:spermidine synthase